MKVLEEVAAGWSQQVQAFQADEEGRQFYEYLTFWVDTAERLMDELTLTPHAAMNDALALVEANVANLDASFMGQMLLNIVSAWEHGHEFAENLSPIEMKLVVSAAQHRQQLLRDQAEQEHAGQNGVTSSEVTPI